MAQTKLIFNLIQKSALPIFTITPGNIYVCIVSTNNYVYYYDANETSRIKSEKFKYEPSCASLEDLKLLPHPQSGIVYITTDGGFFVYDDIATSWAPVEYLHEISTLLGIYDTLKPATAYNYDINGIKVNYAFKTVASAVYTSTGDTVENALRFIRKAHIVTDKVVCLADGQTEFTVPYPDPYTKETYLSQGNTFIVFIGSVLIDPSRYTISTDNEKIIFTDTTDIKKDRSVLFMFLYNTSIVSTAEELVTAIDGNDIVNSSIPTRKLALTTTSYNVNSATTVATAASVYSAVQYLLNKLDALDPNKIIFTMTAGVGNAYTINVPGWTLSDGSFLNLKLNAPMLDNATLAVNGGTPIQIYQDYNTPVKALDVDVDSISLYYNGEQNRFYISSGLSRSLNHSSYVYTAPTDGIAYIDLTEVDPITGKKKYKFDFDPFVDNLTLYQDGIYLIETKTGHEGNYTFDLANNRIAFDNYTLDKGTTIVFDVQYIEQLRTVSRQIKTQEWLDNNWSIDASSGSFLIKYGDIVTFKLDHDSSI